MSEKICIDLYNEELRSVAESLGMKRRDEEMFCGDVKKWLILYDRQMPLVERGEDVELVFYDNQRKYVKKNDLQSVFKRLKKEGYKDGKVANGKEFNSCVTSKKVTGYDIIRQDVEDDDVEYLIVDDGEDSWMFCGKNDDELKKFRESLSERMGFEDLINRIDDYLGK